MKTGWHSYLILWSFQDHFSYSGDWWQYGYVKSLLSSPVILWQLIVHRGKKPLPHPSSSTSCYVPGRAPGHGWSFCAVSADSFWNEAVGFEVVEAVPANLHISFKYWIQKITQLFPICPVLKMGLQTKWSWYCCTRPVVFSHILWI